MTPDLLERQSMPETSTGEEDMSQYLRDIRSYPLLKPEQELDLARRCAAGDEEAIRQMVNSNLRLVVSVARKYAGRGVPLLDLIQEGSIGLLTAARKFDYTRNNRFSTYATKWIYRGIARYLLEQGKQIRVPAEMAQQMQKVQQTRNLLQQRNGEAPTLEELAAYCGMPEEKVEELLYLQPELCSLDAPLGDAEKGSLGLFLEDLQNPQPQTMLIRRELEQMLEQLLQNLDDRQRRILRLHFGLEDGICHSLEKISGELGLSKERVRQIEKQAMKRMQILGANLGLEDFLVE